MTLPKRRRSNAERIAFVILYILIAMFSFGGAWATWIPYSPIHFLITFVVSLIVWYFILRFIVWLTLKVIPGFIHLFKIPNILWKVILNRVREFGKALRNEN